MTPPRALLSPVIAGCVVPTVFVHIVFLILPIRLGSPSVFCSPIVPAVFRIMVLGNVPTGFVHAFLVIPGSSTHCWRIGILVTLMLVLLRLRTLLLLLLEVRPTLAARILLLLRLNYWWSRWWWWWW